MKKIFILVVSLLLTTPCFARTDVLSNVGNYITNGQVSVSSSAAVSLGSSDIMFVKIINHATNKGVIYVGNSNVSTSNGYCLATNEVIDLNISSLSKVYVIAPTDVAQESFKVDYIAVY